jgi:hypothetical protein
VSSALCNCWADGTEADEGAEAEADEDGEPLVPAPTALLVALEEQPLRAVVRERDAAATANGRRIWIRMEASSKKVRRAGESLPLCHPGDLRARRAQAGRRTRAVAS